jgi:DNA-binding transcriptional regulator PaaX
MNWALLIYRLPAEPSRHRVAVWRKLRRVGALSLQQATWAVPSRADFLDGVERAASLVEVAQGEAIVLDVEPRGDESRARLEAAFTADREAEWTEFLGECNKYEDELEKEIRTKKFTPAELTEEEQNLDRLRRWYRDLRARDVFKAPPSDECDRRLKECTHKLEEFAERVFKEVERQ